MDLTSEAAYWPLKNGLPTTFPSLQGDLHCEIAVLGAGITGALVANALTAAGMDVIVVDKREAVHGSTSASTGLLQYEIDASLVDLAQRHGESTAVRAYQLCAGAIDRIASLTGELDDHCGFARHPSCYLASRSKDLKSLREEYDLRRKHGFDVQFLTSAQVSERFDFEAPGALWTEQAAQVDSYRMTYQLLDRARSRGARIFDRTEVTEISTRQPGWLLATASGASISAQRLVVATGYEAVKLLPRKLVRLHSTYALASQPLDHFNGWPEKCLLWETARPYFYVRSTEDGRAVVGGEDEKFRSPTVRDALIPRKAKRLTERFREMFPQIPFEVEYAWAGTFAETPDGLPYIGCLPDVPDAVFALGYGGNGITYSMLAADLISAHFRGEPAEDMTIFRFFRD